VCSITAAARCRSLQEQVLAGLAEPSVLLSWRAALHSLSLANVRILADASYTRWDVEVSAPTGYLNRTHKLTPFFSLVFRRSSIQHPLLAGALGECSDSGCWAWRCGLQLVLQTSRCTHGWQDCRWD
jgi:hypothetical protein